MGWPITVLSFILSLIFFHPQDEKIAGAIIRLLDQYISALPQDKVYIHTDKPHYSAGEDIWFKAYLVSGPDHLPVQPEAILYVELVNPIGSVVEQRMIRMNRGSGHGDFALSPTLLPGNYVLRAYTRFMENYDPEFLFRKQINILPRTREEYQNHNIDSDISSAASTQVKSGSEIIVHFFPEGGDMVLGLKNQVAFKAMDGNGKGIQLEGTIIDSNGSMITEFSANILGMSVFNITPVERVAYAARIKYKNEVHVFPLPISRKEGYVMHLIPSGDKIFLSVRNNMDLKMNDTFVIGQMRGKPFTIVYTRPDQDSLYAEINTSELSSGIAHFTFFDSRGIPQCERLAFIDNSEDFISPRITSDRATYGKREKAIFNIRIKDPNDLPVSAELSASITNTDLVNPDDIQGNIKTYLLLTSDLKGYVENPSYYFDRDTASRYEDLDILMLTHGWRRFIWDTIILDGPPSDMHPFESGFTIEGQLFNYYKRNEEIPGFISMFLYLDNFYYDEIQTDIHGKFAFHGLNINDTSVVVLQARKDPDLIKLGFLRSKDRVKDNIFIKVKNSHVADVNPMYWPTRYKEMELEILNEYLASNEYILKIDSAFEGRTILLEELIIQESKIESKNPLEISKKYYFEPDYQVVIDSLPDFYQDLNIMDILQREVPGILVLGSPPNQTVTFTRNLISITEGYANPLFLWNGLPVEIDMINYLKGSEISYIDVLKGSTAAVYGSRGLGGLIAIYAQEGPRYEKPGEEGKGITNYLHPGYYRAREFYYPDYDTPDEKHAKPDFRSTLYWNPVLRTDEQGEVKFNFFTSDETGAYCMRIEGITDDGKPVIDSYYFSVK